MAVRAREAAAALDPEVNCLSCGALYEPGQEYCLECGARIVRPRGAVHALGRAWRRRLGWYPGDWMWGSLLALAVAASATAAVTSFDLRSRQERREVIVALSKLQPAPEPPPPPAPEPRRGRRLPKPPVVAPAAPRRPELIEWPAASGYTVVLVSVPVGAGLGTARKKGREALRAGLPQVGVLASSRYPSLHPGYWVIFSGIYGSLEEAQSAVSTAQAKFPSAYAREISR